MKSDAAPSNAGQLKQRGAMARVVAHCGPQLSIGTRGRIGPRYREVSPLGGSWHHVSPSQCNPSISLAETLLGAEYRVFRISSPCVCVCSLGEQCFVAVLKKWGYNHNTLKHTNTPRLHYTIWQPHTRTGGRWLESGSARLVTVSANGDAGLHCLAETGCHRAPLAPSS